MAKKKVFSEEEKELMVKMYNDGETYAVISKTLHTKAEKVSNLLKSMGYGVRPKNTLKNHEFLSNSRKHHFNESYFEKIDTPEKAYWLGFLYADGSINKKYDSKGNPKGGSLEIGLKKDDEYHIRNFLDDISYDSPKISEKKVILNGNTYYASRIVVSSIKMVDDLINLGCTERKSLTLLPPKLSEPYVSHFIRGYFDGDGCVCFYPERYSYTYSILGTYEILDFIRTKANIPNNRIISFKHKKCFELVISSKEDISTFHNYIYADKTIYLQRKYDRSLAMMRFRKIDDCRNETQKMADLLSDDYYPPYDEGNFSAVVYQFSKTERSETAAMADLLD